MTDPTALIQRWQAGDERAAEALYYQYRDSTFRLAYGLLGNAADAEEATQDALNYALTRINLFDPGRASFSTKVPSIHPSISVSRIALVFSILGRRGNWANAPTRSFTLRDGSPSRQRL